MKSLLCVLLTMIISLGSMVTVKADTEIKPYENKENAVLLKREYIDLDEDTVIEIESYEEKIPSLARAGWKMICSRLRLQDYYIIFPIILKIICI